MRHKYFEDMAVNEPKEAIEEVEAPKNVEKKGLDYNDFIVTADLLNVRRGPGKNYNVDRILKKGDVVKIDKVVTGYGHIGNNNWVSMEHVKVIE